MKKKLILLVAAGLIVACTTKKTVSTGSADSLKIDSTVLADVPAPAALAYSLMPGYSVRNTVGLADTVNFILLRSQEEIDKNFSTDKSAAGSIAAPDFIINHIIGVACLPTMETTTITLDKVEVGPDAINVYVNIQRGENQSIAVKPSQIFAIEKRDGVANIQFFVNGKMDKSFFLTGL